MRTITFLHPGKLVFGPEAYATMKQDIMASGDNRVFVVSIEPLGAQMDELRDELAANGIRCEFDFSIVDEPTFAEFEELLDACRPSKPTASSVSVAAASWTLPSCLRHK